MNYKQMIIILTMIVALLITYNIKIDNAITLKEENIKILENENDDLYKELAKSNSKIAKYEGIINTIDSIDLLSENEYEYTYYNVDLTIQQQQFIQNLCFEHNFSYEMVLGIIHSESNFKLDAVSYNNTSLGIMQVNKNYSDSFAKMVGLDGEYDLFDFETNVRLGFANLIYSRDYWINQGYTSEEDLTMLVLSSYNRGVGGTIKYGRINGTFETNYAHHVLNYKFLLEMGLI